MFTDRLACIFEQADLAPLTASKFYKVRRKVAAILKSVNRHLRIRALFGTSEIAVKIQMWMQIYVPASTTISYASG